MGASGLGLGAFSVVSSQGLLGEDAYGGIQADTAIPVVKILNPDEGETVWGTITIRAFIYEVSNYSIKILVNNSLIGSSIPFIFNTTTVPIGWSNITVIVNDTVGNVGEDSVIVFVDNSANHIIKTYIRFVEGEYMPVIPVIFNDTIYVNVGEGEKVFFRFEAGIKSTGIMDPGIPNPTERPATLSFIFGTALPEPSFIILSATDFEDIFVNWVISDVNGLYGMNILLWDGYVKNPTLIVHTFLA